MNCLTDYIGILGCDNSVTPNSGLYVNSLAGISLKSIDALADAEQQTYIGVWNDVQTRAARRFEMDFNTLMNRKFQLRTPQRSQDLGKDISTTVIAASANLKGVTLRTNFTDTNFTDSVLVSTYVQTISIYSDGVANGVAIKVYDVALKSLLYTKTVDLIAGWNDVNIYQSFSSQYIFVGYDATLVTSLSKSILSEYNLFGYGVQGFIMGAESNLGFTNMTESAETGGLSIVWGTRCGFTSLVCNNKDLFTSSWWYLLGIELMNERLSTERINSFTTVNLKKAEELKLMYEAMYMGGTYGNIIYEGALNQAVSMIRLDLSDACIECNQPVTIRETNVFGNGYFTQFNTY